MKTLIENMLSHFGNRPKPQGYWNRGFTLVEMMVALAVGSMVMAVIYSVNAGLLRTYTTQNVVADIQQTVRAGVDFLAQDIMMAGYDPLDKIGYEAVDEGGGELPSGIIEARSTRIRVTSDNNEDGDIDTTDLEDITYDYDAANKRLDQLLYNGDRQTYIDNVVNLEFTYFDENGDDLIVKYGSDPVPNDNRSEVRAVRITITVREPAGQDKWKERTYTTQVVCRNMGIFL